MSKLPKIYREALWQVYARSVSLISVLGILVAVVMGGYDVVQWIFPRFTLNASLTEKYQSDEAYTKFDMVKKDRPPEEITRERQLDYEKMLRMERRNAEQSLVKVGLALLTLGLMNLFLIKTYRPNGTSESS